MNPKEHGAKAQYRIFTRLLCLFLLLLLAGCQILIEGKPPGPWHEAYLSLEHDESVMFISNALAQAVSEFGEPVIPVKQVLLRRSLKSEKARRYSVGENFTRTACIDSSNGVFVIYMGKDPSDQNYFPLLAHECVHLLNADITDWYMEGIATDFSERFCTQQGLEWGDWKHHFSKSRRDPYALSYRMMSRLREEFVTEYNRLTQYAVANGGDEGWLKIDINAWLEILPENGRKKAVEIISPHVEVLQQRQTAQYSFDVPHSLK